MPVDRVQTVVQQVPVPTPVDRPVPQVIIPIFIKILSKLKTETNQTKTSILSNSHTQSTCKNSQLLLLQLPLLLHSLTQHQVWQVPIQHQAYQVPTQHQPHMQHQAGKKAISMQFKTISNVKPLIQQRWSFIFPSLLFVIF